MTKEQILENNDVQDVDFYTSGTKENVILSMDEYAKQECIEFAKWIEDSGYKPIDLSKQEKWIQAGGKKGWLIPGFSIVKQSDYLYERFLEDSREKILQSKTK